MSLIPVLYTSADAGAPALTGQAGALRDLLRAVLVTGYGSGPGAKPAAGWTEPFIGTNKSVFRNNPVTGTGGLVRVDDSATVASSNARYALVRAYESMTDIDTGAGPAPTVAQRANGVLVPKSGTLDATSRAWVALASERFIYLFTDLGNTAAGWIGVASFPLFMGDIVSRRAGDNYEFLVMGSNFTTFIGLGGTSGGLFVPGLIANTPGTDSFLLRNYLQSAGSKTCQLAALCDGTTVGVIGNAGTYPDPVSGGLVIERLAIYEGARQIRGYLPNVYGTINGQAFADMAQRTDIEGVPTGTTLLAKRFSQVPGAAGSTQQNSMLLFDLTNAWG